MNSRLAVIPTVRDVLARRTIRQFPCMWTPINSNRDIFTTTQRRTFGGTNSVSNNEDDKQLVYTAPMARSVRLMKGVSLTSCTLTSIGTPTLCFLSEQATSTIGKWAMCGTIMLFGLGTTSLFHVLFKPYVMRMWINRTTETDPTVTVETLTLFAQLTQHQFRLSDVALPEKSLKLLMVSFRANDKHFFIHPECIEDQVLAQKLMGEQYRPPVKEIAVDEEF